MKNIYKKISATLILALSAATINAQFSGAYAPANWGTVAVNSNGMTYTTGAPSTVSMTSSDGLTGQGTNDFTITIPQSGVISFSWNYSTVDGPQYDWPLYVINGATTMPTGYSTAGLTTQNGTQSGICVAAGNVFAFRMISSDNVAGPATTIFNNFVFTPAALTITASSPTICAGTTLALTASGGGSYSWSGGISNGVAFTPTNNSVYTVTTVVAGCTAIKSYTPLFFPSITVNSSANPICTGSSAILTAAGGTTYAWNTGPSTSTISVSPTSNLAYTVSGTTSDGCSSSAAITVSVNPGTPTLTVVSSTNSTCYGKTATLTASGALSYTWTGGVTNGVSFYPSTTTAYTVSGQNGCGISTAVTTITIVPLPLSMALTPALYCTNSTATLAATSSGTSYTWNPGGIVNTNPILIVNPSVTTVYTVTVSDGTCSGTSNVTLVANPAPTINASSSSSVLCPGGSINLTATGGINYTWSPGGMTGNSINVSPSLTLVYTVIGDNSAGCTSGASQIVIVGTQPTLAISASNYTICNGAATTLSITGANSYMWSNGPITAVNTVSPTQSTSYSVVGTNAASGCTATANVNIEVYTPVLTITGNTVVCSGLSTSLVATGATGYTWEPGPVPFQGFNAAPTANTVYTLTAISNSMNVVCPATATVAVMVNPNPTVTASGVHSVVCAKQSNTFTAAGAVNYTWTTPSTVVAAPSVTVTSAIAAVLLYTVTGRDALGCEATAVVPVNFNACLGIDQLTIGNTALAVYPNPSNGSFVIKGTENTHLKLINELGQEIRKISLNEENDHTFAVTGLSNGIYFVVSNKGSQKVIVNK